VEMQRSGVSRGKIYAGAASSIVGLSAVSLLLILQSPMYAIHDFGLAIATTGVVICLLLGASSWVPSREGPWAGSVWLHAGSAWSSGV
jgi:hypothetical protein